MGIFQALSNPLQHSLQQVHCYSSSRLYAWNFFFILKSFFSNFRWFSFPCPPPRWCLIFFYKVVLLSSFAHFLFQVKLPSFLPPKPYMLLFFLLIQLLQLSSSSQWHWMHRFLHRALLKSQPSLCPSALPVHTKRIRSSDCKCTQQMLQQQMLQQHRAVGLFSDPVYRDPVLSHYLYHWCSEK